MCHTRILRLGKDVKLEDLFLKLTIIILPLLDAHGDTCRFNLSDFQPFAPGLV